MFYQPQKINSNLYAIKSLSGEYVFLVIGSERALLIDTCLGYGNLREVVEKITDKPITVALTHGHVDHALGAPEFSEVYMNLLDVELYQEHCKLDHRLGYMQGNLGPDFNIDESQIVTPNPDLEFKPLTDQQVFELGGINVSFHHLAGHTAGMMVALIEELEILIVSDACNNSTFLFDEQALSVTEYQTNLKIIEKRLRGLYKQVFISHHNLKITSDVLVQMIELCDQVNSGDVDNIPFNFMGHQALIAKACNQKFQRNDGLAANLIYNPKKI